MDKDANWQDTVPLENWRLRERGAAEHTSVDGARQTDGGQRQTNGSRQANRSRKQSNGNGSKPQSSRRRIPLPVKIFAFFVLAAAALYTGLLVGYGVLGKMPFADMPAGLKHMYDLVFGQ